MADQCDRLWEIDALREGRLGSKDAEAFERHIETCGACKDARARNERLRNLAAELPAREPTELDLRRLRARVLRDVEQGLPQASPWPRRSALAFAVALCGVAIVLVHRHTKTPATNQTENIGVSSSPSANASSPPQPLPANSFAGTVTAQEDARFTQTRDGDVEHVGLENGVLNLHVRHQGPSEHFFVDLPDGQIEVRGTTFRVEAHHGVTTRIDVSEGVVSVRLNGLAEMWLSAGQNWTRPEAATAHAPKSNAPTHAIATDTNADDQNGSDDYAAAVSLMSDKNYDAAAAAFAAFLTAHPKASQAEDASYLEAAALARAGRVDAAGLAAEHHLAAYPRSFHGKDAAILVARAARDRGDCDKARSVLAPWLGANADPEAVATLRSCAAP
jgi:TolA-binding protein